LSRNPRTFSNKAHAWEPTTQLPPGEALEGVTHVVHLAGESVAGGRWTEGRKRRIRDSRVIGTRNLVAGLSSMKHPPGVLICASAVGYYGDRENETLDESSLPGRGFLAEVCAQWEREALQARSLGIRVVCLRFGVVLSREGGALSRMLPPFRMGMGGRLGGGHQWMPWIHVDDVVGLIGHALGNASIEGAMNAVAPNPVTNRKFSESLGAAVNRSAVIPVPETVLRLAFGEMASVLMASQRVLPRQAERTGYRFQFEDIDAALKDAVKTPVGRQAA
jgi:uncharacterized protein (TIGR01777 family)